MTSEISTQDLFHYTRIDSLLSIITNGFYPRYNLEFTYLSDLYKRQPLVPIPMVCFCDIPLKLAEAHTGKYGDCAIGLKKTWGKRHGLNPVFYVDPNSMVGDAFATIADSWVNYHSSMISKESNHTIFQLIGNAIKGYNHITYFIKQFEIPNTVVVNIMGHEITLEKRRFYDEREWRYVPIRTDLLGEIPMINHTDLFDDEKRNRHNRQMEKYALTFEVEDISYILCSDEEQLSLITNALEKRYSIRYGQSTSELKILKWEDIGSVS